jgi:hypothetical protein
MKLKSIIFGAFGLNCVCFLAVTHAQFTKSANTKNTNLARESALSNIAKHFNADSCWKYEVSTSIKIGDPIPTAGTETGKIPTSCVINPKTGQYLEVGYIDNELQVIRSFSKKEVTAKLSEINSKEKK